MYAPLLLKAGYATDTRPATSLIICEFLREVFMKKLLVERVTYNNEQL